MIPAQRLAAARHRALAFATADVTIDRATGDPTFDPVTGTIGDAARTTIYSGEASVSTRSPANGEPLQTGQVLVRAPLSANDVQAGDRVTINRADDWPTGATLWVHEVQGRHVAVLARIICVTQRPGADRG